MEIGSACTAVHSSVFHNGVLYCNDGYFNTNPIVDCLKHSLGVLAIIYKEMNCVDEVFYYVTSWFVNLLSIEVRGICKISSAQKRWSTESKGNVFQMQNNDCKEGG